MKRKRISETMENISLKYVNEADNYTRETKHRSGLFKWGTIAACFAIAAVLGIGIFQSTYFGGREESVTLDNGSKINFIKSKPVIKPDIAFKIEARHLTEVEVKTLFRQLPVTARAIFNAENKSILGIEGEIGTISLTLSLPNVMLNDTALDGKNNVSEVNGILVNAGYFINDMNVVYYASFKLDENLVYIEHSGVRDESEAVRSEISDLIQNLIALEKVDLTKISR